MSTGRHWTHALLIFCIIGASWSSLHARRPKDIHEDPEVEMDAYHLIASKGYPCERHIVQTQDGYRLAIFRIPHGVKNGHKGSTHRKKARPVIFLQHGLLCSCTNWITNLQNESLAFLLADAGFDVWLGNFRGNTYARRHIRLDPEQKEFWQFSWDQMASYDLPAMIDFAIATSGARQLYYVGHSEGTLTAFAAFSSNHALGKKIKHYFALAPVATVGYIEGPLSLASQFHREMQKLMSKIGVNEFLPSNFLVKILAQVVCGILDTNPLCENILFLIAGYDSGQLNSSRIPVYLSHTPAGTSVRNMIHFAQMQVSKRCCKYDYGSPRENRKRYGQASPPDYVIENMKVPVSIFCGDLDWLADPHDVRLLKPRLHTLRKEYRFKKFNHLDFIWGLRAPSLVYKKIIDHINGESNG